MSRVQIVNEFSSPLNYGAIVFLSHDQWALSAHHGPWSTTMRKKAINQSRKIVTNMDINIDHRLLKNIQHD